MSLSVISKYVQHNPWKHFWKHCVSCVWADICFDGVCPKFAISPQRRMEDERIMKNPPEKKTQSNSFLQYIPSPVISLAQFHPLLLSQSNVLILWYISDCVRLNKWIRVCIRYFDIIATSVQCEHVPGIRYILAQSPQ